MRPGIYGIALNGGDKVAAIPDTDQGKLDGDTKWDRAVGPMQFIPSTWASVKQDGNGDGMVDVQQIDDAALSAGIYLCDAGAI
ncbi:MAG: lytic murein transglycosylase [Galactobacter sp.]